MRTRSYAPSEQARRSRQGDRSGRDEFANERRRAAGFTDFSFAPELRSRAIHVPVLTPLVGEDVPGSPPEPVFDSAAQ